LAGKHGERLAAMKSHWERGERTQQHDWVNALGYLCQKGYCDYTRNRSLNA